MKHINVPTKRGSVLNGMLFDTEGADTVVIAITGIHGNFYSNPFYYNFGDTFNAGGIDVWVWLRCGKRCTRTAGSNQP